MTDTVYIGGITPVRVSLDEKSQESLASIAESLKRIADVMDGTKEVEEFTEEVKESIVKKIEAENRDRLEARCPSCKSKDVEVVPFTSSVLHQPFIEVRCNSCGGVKKYPISLWDLRDDTWC